MKKIFGLMLIGIIVFSMVACGGNIDPVAQKIVDDINSIGEVTLDDENLINKISETYLTLTDDQKSQVNNYALFLSAKDELQALIAENNKPIALTVNNIEDYLRFDVRTDSNITSSYNSSWGAQGYEYSYKIIGDVSSFDTNCYYESVEVVVECETPTSTGTLTIVINTDGNGSKEITGTFKHGSAVGDPYSYVKVVAYSISSVKGNVYKHKPQ